MTMMIMTMKRLNPSSNTQWRTVAWRLYSFLAANVSEIMIG